MKIPFGPGRYLYLSAHVSTPKQRAAVAAMWRAAFKRFDDAMKASR